MDSNPPPQRKYLDALLKGIKGNQTQSEQAGTASVQDPDSEPKPVSSPDSEPKSNTHLEGLLCELREKYPPKSPEELEEELQKANSLHSEMDESNERIKAMEEEIKRLKQSSLQLRRAGNALSLRAHLEKGYDQAQLYTNIHDLLYGFWDTPDYEQAITLYEQMLIHYPENHNQACFYLALIYLKGKIDNQNRGKEHRRQNLSNPEKAESYAQMIECPKLLKSFREKSKKYLAKRK
jgi:TPR repeat protein